MKFFISDDQFMIGIGPGKTTLDPMAFPINVLNRFELVEQESNLIRIFIVSDIGPDDRHHAVLTDEVFVFPAVEAGI